MRLLALLLLLLPLSAAQLRREPLVGRVLTISGPWHGPVFSAGQIVFKPLNRYDAVPLGEKIHCEEPSLAGQLQIVVGATIQTLECQPEVVVPKFSEPDNPFKGFVAAMATLLLSHPESLPRPAMARSGGSVLDSVLRLSNGVLDGAPALGKLEPGPYRLQFGPLREGDLDAIEESDVRLEDGRPALAKTSKLKPGLYRLQVVTADDHESDVGTWVAVLLSDGVEFDNATKALQEARAVVAQSKPALSDQEARNLYFLVLSSFPYQGEAARK